MNVSNNINKLRLTEDLTGRVAIISGSTRGIGRECALALASKGVNIVVVGKSTTESDSLPGSIYSVAKECEALGVKALPCQVDMRKADEIEACVKMAVEKFGRVDICINNASALWWHTIKDTPTNKYDLITAINNRGAFLLTKACIPFMEKGGWGRVITMSPPIQTSYQAFKGFTAYNISKFGMTMVAMGAAAEGESKGICANSLWPATVVESQASINFQLGDKDSWRKATCLSDAVVGLCGTKVTGKQWIDDVYLTSEQGFGPEELKVYRWNPDVEPPRSLAGDHGAAGGMGNQESLKVGDVRKVDESVILTRSKM